MPVLRAGLAYFASVFAVGFALGVIRVMWAVPRLGPRWAELLELPLMLAASYACARVVVRRLGPFMVAQRLGLGALALGLLVLAELALVLGQGQSLAQYVANRDPVSGCAYLLSLLAFALMPLLVFGAGVADSAARLVAIKSFHTVVWAFLAGCILALPVAAYLERFRLAAWLIAIVLAEVAVLGFNGGRCPLTAVAARHTDERADNFDIYLPLWLARHNQAIFGSLFAAGLAYAALAWARNGGAG